MRSLKAGFVLVALIVSNHLAEAQVPPPNDPYFNLQLGLHNTGQFGGTPGADIDALRAWEYCTGSQSIIVAVLDYGTDYNQPDLIANIFTNPGEIPGDGIDNDSNGLIDDVHGWDFGDNDNDPAAHTSHPVRKWHGTHVAGIVGAVGNNSTGVTGVAWNVRLLPLKFTGDNGGGGVATAVQAIDYAIAMGARIINCSFQFLGWEPTAIQSLYAAVQRAEAAGVIVVCGAGNDGVDIDVDPKFPASFDLPNIVTVAASDRNDALWVLYVPPFIGPMSNRGHTNVDLAAPGSQIYSTFPIGPGDLYGDASGTSMAAPHVSGAFALLLSRFPTLTHTAAISRLLQYVDVLPAWNGLTVTGGRLNIARALIGSPDISAPASFAFGSAYVGQTKAAQILISNTGIDTLRVLSLNFSQSFGWGGQGAFQPPLSIPPGGNYYLPATFAPDHLGMHYGTLTITSDDPDESTVVVNLQGKGIGPIPGMASTPLPGGDGEPRVLALRQNAPNPMGSSTRISFDLPGEESVQLQVLDITGRRVSVLLNQRLSAGEHHVDWDGRGSEGGRVAPGIYYYRIATPSQSLVHRLIVAE